MVFGQKRIFQDVTLRLSSNGQFCLFNQTINWYFLRKIISEIAAGKNPLFQAGVGLVFVASHEPEACRRVSMIKS